MPGLVPGEGAERREDQRRAEAREAARQRRDERGKAASLWACAAPRQ